MPDLEALPYPLGVTTYIPISKIVRCRWRDEEDYPDKIRVNLERIGVEGFTVNLQGLPLDTVEKLVDYLVVFDPKTYSTREKAFAKAITMPLDLVEQLVGHNRKAACHQLGTWHIWGQESAGKRDLIPFVLKDMPIEEARSLYMKDNKPEDEPTAGWAIGNVRKCLPDMIARGMAKGEAQARLASDMSFPLSYIPKFAEINQAWEDGIASPAMKRMRPVDALEMWRLLKEMIALEFIVTIDEQNEMVENYFQSPNNKRKTIGNAFSKIRAKLNLPEPPKMAKPKKDPRIAGLQYLYKAIAVLQNEELDDEEKQAYHKAGELIIKLSKTELDEEDVEFAVTMQNMEQQEQEPNGTDETAVY